MKLTAYFINDPQTNFYILKRKIFFNYYTRLYYLQGDENLER